MPEGNPRDLAAPLRLAFLLSVKAGIEIVIGSTQSLRESLSTPANILKAQNGRRRRPTPFFELEKNKREQNSRVATFGNRGRWIDRCISASAVFHFSFTIGSIKSQSQVGGCAATLCFFYP
jgi:hypothetical protein